MQLDGCLLQQREPLIVDDADIHILVAKRILIFARWLGLRKLVNVKLTLIFALVD